MDTKRSYAVKLPPSEVLARLAASIDPDGLFAGWGPGHHPHYGRVSNDTFEIRLRTGMGRSFKPVLEGKVTACPEGTLIRVRVAMDSFTPKFTLLWLAGTIGFQILFLLAALIGEKAFRGWVLLAPSGMTLGGLLIYRLGKALSQSEGERLLASADQLWGFPLPEGERSGDGGSVSG